MRARIGRISFFRVTLILSLVGLALTLISFAFPRLPVGVLCFYFCGLWVLWFGCIFVKLDYKIIKLILLWAIIDISILIMFLSATASLGDLRHSQGTEIVWGLAYLPAILSAFGQYFHPSTDKIFEIVQPWFGKVYGGVISDWFSFSYVAAMQLVLVIVFLWVFRMWQQNAPNKR